MAAEPVEPAPASPFRWPSRRRANEAELAARRAAKAGLERLRAHTPRPSPTPEPVEPEAVEPYEPPLPEPVEPAAAEPYEPPGAFPEPEPEPETEPVPAPSEPQAERAPAPAPWDAELDALTEKLVADLRRDLGPASDE
jgi:hypothetical protein